MITAILLLLTSLLFLNQKQTFDLHVHDTYFVLAYTHIFWTLAALLILGWTLHTIADNLLYSNKLSWIQVIATIAGVVLFSLSIIYYLMASASRDAPSEMVHRAAIAGGERSFTIFVLLLFLSFCLFITNLLLGIFTGLRKHP